jgi:hypothetical protein
MEKIGPRYSHVSDPVLQLVLFLSDMKVAASSTPASKNEHKETDTIYGIGSSYD